MAREVRLPQLGQTMEEATVVDCMVKVGDEVKKGDCVFEIETDKATLEMESPADGFVKYILVEAEQTLPVGAPMLVLGDKDEQIPQSFLDSLKTAFTAAKSPPTAPVIEAEPVGDTKTRDKRRATGDEKVDVKAGKTIPFTKKQKITAQRMLKSKREIPCFYLTVKADVTDLVELRTKLNETGSVKISYNDFIIRAVAIGLQKFPIMAGQLAGDTIELPSTINIGLAVSTPDGLIVPVVKDAHKKDVKRIAADSTALIEKAQNEKLLLTDLEGACITVSNLGAFGIDSFIPIVIPGQCSILGIGRITDTCVPENSKDSHFPADCKMGPNVTIRKLMSMSLSVDHRITTGAYAAQFLDFTRKLLEDASAFSLSV